MEILNDPVFLRGMERILIVTGAVLFAWMGYKLYRHGITEGIGKLETETPVMKLVLSGTGPGMFFMAFGGFVLVSGLYTGGANISSTSKSVGTPSQVISSTVPESRLVIVSPPIEFILPPPIMMDKIPLTLLPKLELELPTVQTSFSMELGVAPDYGSEEIVSPLDALSMRHMQ